MYTQVLVLHTDLVGAIQASISHIFSHCSNQSFSAKYQQDYQCFQMNSVINISNMVINHTNMLAPFADNGVFYEHLLVSPYRVDILSTP